MWNPHFSLNHGARCLFHGPELPESSEKSPSSTGSYVCFTYTETRTGRPPGDVLLPLAPSWGCSDGLEVLDDSEGQSISLGRWSSRETGSRSSRPEVPCGSASVATPAQLTWTQFLNTACPSVLEIRVRRPCPDLSSFSTHLHRGCSGKEPGGKLEVRWGWQPMGSQLSVCSLAKEAPSASPHLCAPARLLCPCLILSPFSMEGRGLYHWR